MSYKNITSNLCSEDIFANCVTYQSSVGENSLLVEQTHFLSAEETIRDLYNISDKLFSNLDTSELTGSCIDYDLTDGNILPTSVFKAHDSKLCELDSLISNLNNLRDLDITEWGIDFGCLVNECQTPTVTLGDALSNISKVVCEGVIPSVTEVQPRVESGEVLGNTLTLRRGDTTEVDIDVSDLTSDNDNFITGANLNGSVLNITGTGTSGASVDLDSLKPDSQILTISGNSLSISSGNTITLPISTGGLTQITGSVTPNTSTSGIIDSVGVATYFYTQTGDTVTFNLEVDANAVFSGGQDGGTISITGLPYTLRTGMSRFTLPVSVATGLGVDENLVAFQTGNLIAISINRNGSGITETWNNQTISVTGTILI